MKIYIKVAAYILIFFTGVIFVSDYVVRSSTAGNIYDSVDNIPERRVGLVLGTSKYVADGRRNLFYLFRLQAAKDLYDEGKISYIIVSWDNATPEYNETDTMKRDLIDMWVPEENIYGDYAGFRTLDSIVRAKEIFDQNTYTVISQEFHLQRALFLAQNFDINVVWYTANDVPVSMSPRVWVRERLARVKMMFDIAVWTKPKFWGESINIW